MDVISILRSFNKISLIAFFITLGFVIYEISQFKKEAIKETKPMIPEFKDKLANATKVVIVEENKEFFNKPSRAPLFMSIFLLFIFGVIFLLGMLVPKLQKKNTSKVAVTPIINFITAEGIKVYDEDWQELNDQELSQLKGGNTIIIGIDTLKEADIDRARIKINEDQWKPEHITMGLKDPQGVFYKEYTVGTAESSLKIEAQLHSKTDGWLGD